MELNPCCHHMSHSLQEQEQQQLMWATTRVIHYSYSVLFSGSLCLRTGGAVGTGGQEGKQASLKLFSSALQTYQLALAVSGLTANHRMQYRMCTDTGRRERCHPLVWALP